MVACQTLVRVGLVALLLAGAFVAFLLFADMQREHLSYPRAQTHNNFKRIGLAIHDHADAASGTLPRDIARPDGTPLLSWRVAILPYLEEENLHRQFKLDEPWDGPTNLPLLAKMPRIYLDPRAPTTPSGLTHFQAFIGPRTMFDPAGTPRRVADIPDGIAKHSDGR